MEWSVQDLGSIGEIVGGIGVIASLIYLGTQIRFSTKSTNAESVRELMAAMREVVLRRDRFGIWIEKWLDGDRSTVVEVELKVELRLLFDQYMAIWISIKSGSIDPSVARNFMYRWLGFTFSWSILRDIWRTMEGEYDAEFVEFINAYISENPETLSEEQQLEYIREMNKPATASGVRAEG